MVYSIELKIGKCIIDHPLTYSVDFGEFRFNSLLQGIKIYSFTLQPINIIIYNYKTDPTV